MARTSGATNGRRTWPQRLLLSVNILAIVACVAAATLIVSARDPVADTPRTGILDVEGWVPSERVNMDDPMNFLIVGTDSDEGLDPDDPVRGGRDDVGGA